MIVLMTSCVKPQVSNLLTVTDPKIRLKQYIKAINYYITCNTISGIVLCDNSNFVFPYDELNRNALRYQKRLEIISFKGDDETCNIKGKGFGEGEIIEYALHNSKLLCNETQFVKVTGRLIIENIDSIIKSTSPRYNYFNTMGICKGKNDAVDTRFFIVQKEVYECLFLKCYYDVNDSENITLENIFHRELMSSSYNIKSTCLYPKYCGVSGSTGENYDISSNVAKIVFFSFRCIANRIFDLYNPKNKYVLMVRNIYKMYKHRLS